MADPALDSPPVMRQTVVAYLDAINAHDVNGIISLMADDFQYTNSAGDAVRGRAYMRQEWRRYFESYPDFQIHVQTVIAGEEGVAVFGQAEGTYTAVSADPDSSHWLIPAAYLGTSRGGKIISWQTFSDNSIVFDIMQANQNPAIED